MFFWVSSPPFPKRATLTMYRYLQYFRHFLFFSFLSFFEKCHQKNAENRCFFAARFFLRKSTILEPKTTSKRRPGASRNGSGDRTLSKNARSQRLRSHSFFSLPKKCEKRKKTMILGPDLTLMRPPFFGLVCRLSSDTSPERSRDAPDPHPRGLQTRSDAIFVDFGVILGWFWARILFPEKGEFREKILKSPCIKSGRRPGLPHPQAQTLRVRRSRASVFNPPALWARAC